MSNGDESSKAKKPKEKLKAEAKARRKTREAAPPAVEKKPEKKANAELDPVADAMPPVKPPVKPPENPNYGTTLWHTRPMFQCNHCRWSTLNEDDMIRHAAKHLVGTPRQDVRRTDTGLVTESGNAIIREEIVESDEE